MNAEYDKYVKEDDLMQADGSLVKNDAAFQTSYKGEIANGRLHVFVCDVDGQTKYVLPIYGAGLWGPIWGYIALNDDKTLYMAFTSLIKEKLRVWVQKSPLLSSRISSWANM